MGEGTSFPSGHSAVAFEIAHVLSHHIDRRPASIALYGLAATMAFQRTDSNSHWASDAFLGSSWGYFVAKSVVAAEESRRVSVEPVVESVSGRLGVGITFRF
jgi:membrane-associated phospholipid phosphatase